MDRGTWQATVHGVARVGHNSVTKEREGVGTSYSTGSSVQYSVMAQRGGMEAVVGGRLESEGICVCVCSNKSLQSCPTLCSPMNCSSPGSSVHGIFQARILEQIAISSSRGPS